MIPFGTYVFYFLILYHFGHVVCTLCTVHMYVIAIEIKISESEHFSVKQ